MKSLLAALLLAVASFAQGANYFPIAPAQGVTYYLSPTGSNTLNNGLTSVTPWKTFAKAFSTMAAGDTLVLADGTYSCAAGTGVIHWDTGTYCATSAQVPSGVGRTQFTTVRAANQGQALISGAPLFIGRSNSQHTYIKIDGLTFDNGGSIYNGAWIYVKNTGFYDTNNNDAVFGSGTNDSGPGSTEIVSHDLLFEDIWARGNARSIMSLYHSYNIVVRRAILRNDGCFSAAPGKCGGTGGNDTLVSTVYDSHNVSLQNVFSVDSIAGPSAQGAAGDFASAWHKNYSPNPWAPEWYQNEWLGTIVLNSGLSNGYSYDLDHFTPAQHPSATYTNVIAWDVCSGFNAQVSAGGGTTQNILLSNGTFKAANCGGNGVRYNNSVDGSPLLNQNHIIIGAGAYGVISDGVASNYIDILGTWSSGAYYTSSCSVGCLTSNPLTSALLYLTGVEAGSALAGTGAGGLNYGAVILYKYGVDGTFNGESGFNTLTANSIWPYPNEALIKAGMCTSPGITTGWCASASITRYIWNYLGHTGPY